MFKDSFNSFFISGIVLLFAILGFIIARNLYLFKIAFRNFSQRKNSTFLIILGSLVGAAFISGSLVVNDSFIISSQNLVNAKLGSTVGIIYPRSNQTIWAERDIDLISSVVRNDFSKSLPIFYERLSIRNTKDKDTQKDDVIVSSFDPISARAYEPNLVLDNTSLQINKDEIILSKQLANQLKVNEGDKIDIVATSQISLSFTLKKIIKDNGLIGFNAPLASQYTSSLGSAYISPEIFNSLRGTNIQQSTKLYNAILVSRPPNYDKDTLQSNIQKKLNTIDTNIIFEELHESYSEQISGGGNGLNFGQVLLIVSSFAIIAGLVLMISLYYMIAQERKGELGTLRIIGLTKYAITKLFVFEGFLYSFASSLVGTIVGVGVGALFILIIKKIINNFFSKFDLSSNITLHASLTSLAFAFSGALLVIFFTTVLASFRIANINLVASIRDIPEHKVKKLTLSKISAILIIFIATGFLSYLASKNRITSPNIKAYIYFFTFIAFIGGSTYLLKYYVQPKLIISIASLAILALTIFTNYFPTFKGAWHNGPYLFFINAVIIIISLIILILYNVDLVLKPIAFIFKGFPKIRVVFLVGFQYIQENKLRSGLIASTLALVVFIVSLISILRVEANQVLAKLDPQYNIVIFDQLNREDLNPLLLQKKDEIAGFKELYSTNFGSVQFPDHQYKSILNYDEKAPLAPKPEDLYRDSISAVPQEFFTKDITLTTDEKDIASIFANSNKYIILGKNFKTPSSIFNQRPELKLHQKVKITLTGNVTAEREVIGFIDNASKAGGQFSISFAQAGNSGVLISKKDYDELRASKGVYLSSVYGIKLNNEESSELAGKQVKDILKNKPVSNIIQYDELIKRGTVFFNQLVYLVQGFLALGLIIGLAGVIVVLIRSINERRQQIGTLRAIGVGRRSIVAMFLTESAVIIILSILIGFAAAVFSSYNFYTFGIKEILDVNFGIPYKELSIIFTGILIVGLSFSYLPARKGSNMSPVEATKYIG